MPPTFFQSPGKMMLLAAAILAVAGLITLGAEKLHWFGRLPGDIHVERRGFEFHFPVVTCVIISIILTALLNIFLGKR